MQIYINKNGQQIGPFNQAKVEEMLRFGQILPTDLAIKQGDKNWTAVRNLFVQTSQNSTNPSDFNNFQVVSWAKHRLINPVWVEHKFNSIFAKMVWFFALFFIPALFFIFAIYNLFARLTTTNSIGLFVMAIIITLPFLIIWLIIRYTKQKQAIKLDSEGVETRNGKKYLWKDLYEVRYTASNSVRYNPNPIAMLIATIIVAIMFAGNDKTQIELIFANGKSVIPPLIYNQKEMLNLFETIPAKVGGKGLK